MAAIIIKANKIQMKESHGLCQVEVLMTKNRESSPEIRLIQNSYSREIKIIKNNRILSEKKVPTKYLKDHPLHLKIIK
jgi:hypothetical protein